MNWSHFAGFIIPFGVFLVIAAALVFGLSWLMNRSAEQ